MDTLVGVVGWVFRSLLFEAVFYGIGWAVLKVVTLGRHPEPARDINEWFVHTDVIALVGVLTVVLVVVAAWWLA